ncbi:MAG: hypothetical protein WAW06_10115 [bacterium]
MFDLSETPLVQQHTFTDLEVAYDARSSCREDIWLLNALTSQWDRLDYHSDGWCAPALWRHYVLVSARAAEPTLYVDSALNLTMRGPEIIDPTVRALRIHPGYYRVTLPWVASGVAFGCGGLWVATRFGDAGAWRNSVYRLSVRGEVLSHFPAPSTYASGLEFDGEYLWLADGSDSIFKITTDGDVVCRFGVATDYPGDLARDAAVLWLSEYQRPNNVPGKIYEIDPASSCQCGSATVLDSIDIPGKWSEAIAWTGASLLVASDSLYELDPSEGVRKAYPLPVWGVHSLAWDGSGVWMLCSGPNGTYGAGETLVRLSLR